MNEIIIPEHRRELTDVTRDIRIKTGQFLLDAIEIGRLLFEAKAMVAPGGWMRYVEEELPFSHSWANNYMRIYKKYGAEQLSVFGNPQTTANLSTTKALELLALPEEDREEFIETHDVENMSTRELKQAIREREEAEAARKAAEDRADSQEQLAQQAGREVERLRSELTKAKETGAAAAKKVEDLQDKLQKAKDNEKAAKAQLQKAKENPEIPESVMEQMRQQVAADAAREAAADIQKQLDAAKTAEAKAVKRQQELQGKLDEANKTNKLLNPDMAMLQDTINRYVGEFKKIKELLDKLQAGNPEDTKKIRQALITTIDQMRTMATGE